MFDPGWSARNPCTQSQPQHICPGYLSHADPQQWLDSATGREDHQSALLTEQAQLAAASCDFADSQGSQARSPAPACDWTACTAHPMPAYSPRGCCRQVKTLLGQMMLGYALPLSPLGLPAFTESSRTGCCCVLWVAPSAESTAGLQADPDGLCFADGQRFSLSGAVPASQAEPDLLTPEQADQLLPVQSAGELLLQSHPHQPPLYSLAGDGPVAEARKQQPKRQRRYGNGSAEPARRMQHSKATRKCQVSPPGPAMTPVLGPRHAGSVHNLAQLRGSRVSRRRERSICPTQPYPGGRLALQPHSLPGALLARFLHSSASDMEDLHLTLNMVPGIVQQALLTKRSLAGPRLPCAAQLQLPLRDQARVLPHPQKGRWEPAPSFCAACPGTAGST